MDQTVEAGADYAGDRWHRPQDKVAIAVVSNAIKRDHQDYLRLGRVGFPSRRWRFELRAREHRGELLHVARVEGPVLFRRRAAYQRPGV